MQSDDQFGGLIIKACASCGDSVFFLFFLVRLFPFSFLNPSYWKISVYQVGIPVDREQYIHRLGRTGREGKEGEGILFLAPWEQYFLDGIKDLPMENWPVPHLDPRVKVKVSFFVHSIYFFPMH